MLFRSAYLILYLAFRCDCFQSGHHPITSLKRYETDSIKREFYHKSNLRITTIQLLGWVQDKNGEWNWEEDKPELAIALETKQSKVTSSSPLGTVQSSATPTLPSGSFKPKQSLGQNFLKDGNTVSKIIRHFLIDAKETFTDNDTSDALRAVELGPGAGALTDTIIKTLPTVDRTTSFQCIEIDPRSVELLGEKHPSLRVKHMDVLQVDYPSIASEEGGPLSIIGNLPYYITSQILFALADASHFNAVRSATVTMQYEVAKRIVAPTCTKDYGILSVVFQLYARTKLHFKIPPTVFYPKPKVDSALVGLHFIGPSKLRERLGNVSPSELRKVLTTTFQQRRKTIRNSLKKLLLSDICNGDQDKAQEILDSKPLQLTQNTIKAIKDGDEFALNQELPENWANMRPEQLSPGQFVELTRIVFHYEDGSDHAEDVDNDMLFDKKVWRKLKHGN